LILKEGTELVIKNHHLANLALQKPGSSLQVMKGKSVILIGNDITVAVDHWLTCGKIELSKQENQHILVARS